MIDVVKIVCCLIGFIAIFLVWFYLLGEVKLNVPRETPNEKRLRKSKGHKK